MGTHAMLADMPKLFGSQDARMAGQDSRRVARKASRADVTMICAEGREARVVVGDISSHGCSIGHGGADWVKLGAFVWLRAGAEVPVIGIVRWIREEAAGIEFVRPLTPGTQGLAGMIDDDA